MRDDQVLTELAERIRAAVPGVLGVYVFGSAAAGAAGPDSDLDLAVLAAAPLSELRRWELAQQLAAHAGRDVDLIDLRTASTVLRLQVVAHGRRISGVDPRACTAFEDFVFADYARLNEERAAILADVRRRGTIYG